MNCQSRFDAGYKMLGAGTLGWPRGIDNILTLKFQLFNDSTYEQILISNDDLVPCNCYIDIFILAKNLYRAFRSFYLLSNVAEDDMDR